MRVAASASRTVEAALTHPPDITNEYYSLLPQRKLLPVVEHISSTSHLP